MECAGVAVVGVLSVGVRSSTLADVVCRAFRKWGWKIAPE